MKKHFSKVKMYVVSHKIISAAVLILLLMLGYWGYKKFIDGAGDIRYITAKVERGTIVASVSGSGQVSSFNQVDVKAKVSGDVVYIAAEDGQKMGAGGLIAQLDTKDAQKSVRDAELNLESAKISLNKLKIQNSIESLNADLAKAFDDGFNTVANVYIDLPGIMTGLNDMFFKSSVGSFQRNIDWYEGQIDVTSADKGRLYKQNFSNSYDTALESYNISFENYKVTSRTADNLTIENLISRTYDTTKLISDAVKNANNYIDFVNDSMQKRDIDTPAMITTHKANLSNYTSKTNTHLLNLLSIKTNIKEYRDAFPNADLDMQSAELSVKQKENALADTKSKLADYFIRAPFDGTVAKINIKKSDTISAGTIVTTFITAKQLAEISLNEVDVAKVKIGQKANLIFDAIPDLTISGVVADIDTVGTVSQGVVTYIVKTSFDVQDERVKPGMSVSAAIITDTKQDVLIVPNSAVKSQAGKNYIEMFIKSFVIPSRVFVEIGLANDTQSEIISGIKESDEIITRTILPTAASSSAPSIFGSPGGNRGTTGGNVRIQAR